MTVAWTDFVVLVAAILELFDAIFDFKERGKNHDDVRTAAEKYRKLLKNLELVKLIADARRRLNIKKILNVKLT